MGGGFSDVVVWSHHTFLNVSSAESIEGLQNNNEWVTYRKIEWKQLHHSLTLVLTALVQYISNKEKRSLRDMVFYFPVYSRAIHLEMIDDMTTDSFINALRAFIAIRGNVCQLRCDQGSNFVGARREFGELMKGMDQERVKALGCEFLMNPPAASHMRGVWERQIRTARSVLSAVLDQSAQRLDSTSLRTFLYEVMALVNSRPLTTEHLNDPSGPEPLTPNHSYNEVYNHSTSTWTIYKRRSLSSKEVAQSTVFGKLILDPMEKGISFKLAAKTEVAQKQKELESQ